MRTDDCYQPKKLNAYARFLILYIPPLVLVLFYNFYNSVIDISGSYDLVCRNSEYLEVLHYIFPKVPYHCDAVFDIRENGYAAFREKDLVIVLDFLLLLIPIAPAILMWIQFRKHFNDVKEMFESFNSGSNNRNIPILVRAVNNAWSRYLVYVGFFLLTAFGIFLLLVWSPITGHGLSAPARLGGLLTDYGIGLFGHSLIVAFIPYLVVYGFIFWRLYGLMKKKGVPAPQ